MNRLLGIASKAPCWWCGRQLHGWKGWPGRVDGNEVIFHGECLAVALDDHDLRGRVESVNGKFDQNRHELAVNLARQQREERR